MYAPDLKKIAAGGAGNLVKHLIAANPKTKYFITKRVYFDDETTLSETLTSEDLAKLYGWTLEDQVQPKGVKVHGETAIPENLEGYPVNVRKSPKYGEVAVLFTQIEHRDGMKIFVLEKDGIRFEFVLAHGGNTEKDTEGCLLCARNKVSDTMIQGSLKEDIALKVKHWIKEGFNVRWIVIGDYEDRLKFQKKSA